jgi:hypothetical protein
MRDLAESQFQVEKVQQMADVWPRAKRVVALQEKASVAPLSMAADSPSPLLSSKDSIPTVSGRLRVYVCAREEISAFPCVCQKLLITLPLKPKI